MDKQRILICDDEMGIRESLNLILSERYELSFCTNGKECLEFLAQDKGIDLLLIDIKMPHINGLDTLRAIKEKHPDLRAIVITGYRSVETAQEAIKAGALDYIIKPFASSDILASVERNLKR